MELNKNDFIIGYLHAELAVQLRVSLNKAPYHQALIHWAPCWVTRIDQDQFISLWQSSEINPDAALVYIEAPLID